MEYGKIHRLETLIILPITQAQLPASFQEGEPMKDQKTDTGDRQQQSSPLTDILAPKKILVLCVTCWPSCMTVSCLQGCIIPGVHADPERVTLILSLCQGVFMNQFIFRHILGHIFPQKKRISTIWGRRYQKGKLNAKKNIIFRSVSFADLFVEFKRYSVFTPKPF